ncbi:MAG: hypothetical protein IH594_02205 [Bacteroidales bacterium]|nr:hypothetical protein [Bacteroidales bacterium]
MNKLKGNGLTDVLAYLKNLISDKERNAFERKMQRDPFEEEAMEGFESLSPEDLQSDLLKLTGRLNRRLEHRNRFMLYRIAASVSILVVVSALYFTLSDRQLKDFKGVPEVSEATREEKKVEEAPLKEPGAREKTFPPGETEKDVEPKSVPGDKQSESQIITLVPDEETEAFIAIEEDAVPDFREEVDTRATTVVESKQEIAAPEELNATYPAAYSKEKKRIQAEMDDEVRPVTEKAASQPLTATRQAALPQALNIAPESVIQEKMCPAKDSLMFPTLPKWKLLTNFPVYTPDNLWNYINGAATVYLAYGFTSLRMAEYTKGKNSITVEIYNHKDAYTAFGIYSSERSPGYNFIDVGAQGYLEGSVLNFFTAEYYVKIHSNSEKPPELIAMKEIAENISQQISPQPDFPDIIRRFPLDGKVPNSEKYISQNYLGHDFLQGVFTADYKKEEEFTIFHIERSGPDECRQLLMNYFEFTGQDPDDIKEGMLVVRDKFNGDVFILWKGNRMMGIVGSEDEEKMSELLMRMME